MIALARLEGPLRHAVHRFKYGDRPQLAGPLVAATLVPSRVAPWTVVPVPLHPARRRRRGYNQAQLLALELTTLTGAALLDGLSRGGAGERQVGRGGQGRRLALGRTFSWTAPRVPEAVLLVDDVLTTGTTLLECALAAKRAGARRVDALAIALG
ncbi:MAG: ComF family protein [Candidatus Dormibacteraeota bacterium]|nr:ComF family protein [Candidatus Dormibacteraeota bacterium]